MNYPDWIVISKQLDVDVILWVVNNRWRPDWQDNSPYGVSDCWWISTALNQAFENDEIITEKELVLNVCQWLNRYNRELWDLHQEHDLQRIIHYFCHRASEELKLDMADEDHN